MGQIFYHLKVLVINISVLGEVDGCIVRGREWFTFGGTFDSSCILLWSVFCSLLYIKFRNTRTYTECVYARVQTRLHTLTQTYMHTHKHAHKHIYVCVCTWIKGKGKNIWANPFCCFPEFIHIFECLLSGKGLRNKQYYFFGQKYLLQNIINTACLHKVHQRTKRFS